MKKESSPLQVLFGLGLLVLAATAPTQIVLASKVTPPSWVALVSASATALAGFGASGAAYFSSQQARQVALSRKADYLVPATRELIGLVVELEDAVRECWPIGLALATLSEQDLETRRAKQDYQVEKVENSLLRVFEASERLRRRFEDAVVDLDFG